MCASIRECIDHNGAVDFQNLVGTSVGNFMALLEFYLKSTFISFNDNLYVERQGIGVVLVSLLCFATFFSINRLRPAVLL